MTNTRDMTALELLEAHAEALQKENERLRGQLNFANREPPHCPSCNCGASEPNSVPTEKRFDPLGGDVRDDVVIGWACQKCERLNYIGLPPERCEGCGSPRGEKKSGEGQ